MLGSITSVQIGAALATELFPIVGAPGAVLLRLGFAALALVAVTRPNVRAGGRRGMWLVAAFGVTLAAMNGTFYLAIERIPLGVAVTVEFVGPLLVALRGSRRRVNVLWPVLAAGGVALLTSGGGDVRLSGILLALATGGFWAAYILLSQQVGRVYPGSGGLAIALAIALVCIAPFGAATGGAALGRPSVLAFGFGVGMLSSAVPYSLELAALRRLPAHVFGVLMSLEPGMAALAGWLVIGQALSGRAVVALVLVSGASLGSTLAHRRQGPASADPHGPASEGSLVADEVTG